MHSTQVAFVIANLYTRPLLADGRGLIGWGKTMYHPTCAFACRGVVKGCSLMCTPGHDGEVFGMGHSTTTTPPDCYTSDPAFLRTMALCLDTYCPLTDNPTVSLLEDFWSSHLATGTVGDYQWQPSVSYVNAVAAARKDEARAGNGNGNTICDTKEAHAANALPTIKPKQHLNVTSFIAEADWQKQYNGMMSLEINETGHSTYTITVMLVGLFLPVVLSLVQFIPGLSQTPAWASLNSMLIHPAVWGRMHREPVAIKAGGGIVPTRGQSLYISTISFLNIVFLLAPYHMIQPQSSFASREEQEQSIIGNRAGVMALGNMIVLFVFSARNNVLLWVTDWSHGTYLLLHRWLGYWTIIHTVVHSIMLLEYYKKYGDYAMEQARPYWIWGIVGTVAVVAIWPASLPIARQKFYEAFLALHHLLVVLFLVGFYYHIWYCYTYNWGYEIWAFIAIAIWAIDRLWRIARMVLQGVRTAVVAPLQGTDGEYLRIEIKAGCSGRTILFSVASSMAAGHVQAQPNVIMKPAIPDPEKSVPGPNGKLLVSSTDATTAVSAILRAEKRQSVSKPTTFIARSLTGVTVRLAARVAASGSLLRIPVLLDGSYHSNVTAGLPDCSSLICIAGVVGVTGVLPVLRSFRVPQRARLIWGVRKQGLVEGMAPEMSQLSKNISVSIFVGKRMGIAAVLGEGLAGEGEKGPAGIVVCGPPGMADEARARISELGRSGACRKSFVFVDEAFSW
ncbi:hypothetical protein INS49_007486 [Diaporthe citri]|uniref:uncharacterized protein n=1 Tax=Diaporthe citri TaxID=83186 RepID=UPI001C825113|nr:uncharacterized protein INS49_007486 [Diaporthe citri]KAG6353314.1 hypothetical protein INS49_007486 [Diaporthe citri]